MRILKYRIYGEGLETGPIRLNLKQVLNVLKTDDGMWVYVLVDPSEIEVNVNFFSIGTGWEINHLAPYEKYIGTLEDGEGFIWHFFYETWLGDRD